MSNTQIKKLKELKIQALRGEIEHAQKLLNAAWVELGTGKLPNQCGILQGTACNLEALNGELHGIDAMLNLLDGGV